MKTTVVLLALLGLLLGIAGHFDYEDQRVDQSQYCEMVKAKLWPDFRGIYLKECGK